jgi:hypothetical protein
MMQLVRTILEHATREDLKHTTYSMYVYVCRDIYEKGRFLFTVLC